MAASGQEQKMGYYSILGLSNNASPCAIRNSYRKLAMKWHPDKCSNEDPTDAKLKFQEIQEAYTVLSDARKKVLYDNGLYDPNDDDEDIEGLSCFMNELSGLMAEVQATEKKDGKGNSFEELQQLFVDIFSTDNQMEAFIIPNSHPANTTRFNKRSRQTEGSSRFFDDPGSCMRNAHIYFTDSFANANANANAKATKKKKSNTSQDNSWVPWVGLSKLAPEVHVD